METKKEERTIHLTKREYDEIIKLKYNEGYEKGYILGKAGCQK